MRSLSPDAGARILACGLALAMAAPLLAWFDAPVHRPQDEGMLLVYPELLLRGWLPHRDFLASYPPGNFYLLALAFEIFEPSIVVERSVGLAYRLALILGITLLGARRGAAVAAVCGITTALVLHPLRLEAFSWIGGLALLVFGVVSLQAGQRVFSGVLLGLALWFRLDLGLAILLLAAAAGWAGPRGALRELRPAAIGLAATSLPLIVFLVALSPQNAFDDLVWGPIFLTGPARRLPISSLGTNSIRLLLLLGVGTAAALLAAWNSRGLTRAERMDAAVVAALCVGLLPQAFQRLDADHLIYACAVSGGLMAASLDRLLDHLLDRFPILLVTAMTVLTTAGAPAMQLLTTSIEHLSHRPPIVFLNRVGRELPARSEHEITAFVAVGGVLNERAIAGERLFIGPRDLSRTNYSDLHLYFLFPDLVPASYYIELNPRSGNGLGTRLTQDIGTADWLLLSAEWDRWNEPNASSEFGDSRPNQVVRQQFESVARYGVWELFRRRESH